MTKYTVIDKNDQIEIDIDDKDFRQLQKAIGGNFERIKVGRHWAYVDEEGGPMCKNLPLNTSASVLVGYMIYGPMLIKSDAIAH